MGLLELMGTSSYGILHRSDYTCMALLFFMSIKDCLDPYEAFDYPLRKHKKVFGRALQLHL